MYRILIISCLVSFLAINTATAQVTISPTAVFLDSNTKVGNFYVSNPGNSAIEVSLSFQFGYPATTESGRLFLNFSDTEAEEKFSLSSYLRAFPTTFVLQPGQRQTIRMLGRLPSGSEDGMYWTRLKVTSNQLTPPIGEVSEGEIAAQISFQIEQISVVMVHHGNVSTGLRIHQTSAEISENRLIVLTDVERTGNSPFIGSVRTKILDRNGAVINERRSSTAVYFRNNQRVELEIDDLPPGQYTAETIFESSRNDISSQNLIQIPNVSERITFTIE